MEIKWVDINLNRQTIKLENAVNVSINGVTIITVEGGIKLTTDNCIVVLPIASNSVEIKQEELKKKYENGKF